MAVIRHIYWSNKAGGTVHKAELDGSNVTEIQTAVGTPKYCSLHTGNGHLYYSDSVGGKVSRCDLDGSNTVVILSGAVISTYQGIAVDEINDSFYITTSSPNGTERIRKYDLDGSNETIIVSGLMMKDPIGIALDVPNDRLYWMDYTADLIGWSTLDGSSSGIVVGNINKASALDIDRDNNKIYFCSQNVVGRVDTDGNNLEIFISGFADLRGLSIDTINSKIFFTDHDFGNIYKCDFDGSNSGIIITGLTNSGPQGITTYRGTSVVITPSGEPLRIIHRLIKTGDYNPQLIGTFENTPITVNIEIWDIVDGQNTQVTITNSGCYTIGNTSRWGWSTAYLPFTNERQKHHYYYQMTSNEGENVYGEFFITVPEHGLWSPRN